MNKEILIKLKQLNLLKAIFVQINHEHISKTNFQDIGKLKSQILPYLRNIEKLIIKRQELFR